MPTEVAFLILQGDPATSKSRLSSVLTREQRSRLTRYCLARIVDLVDTQHLFLLAQNRAAGLEGIPFAITPILQQHANLNHAISHALKSPLLKGYQSVTIIPNDLPFLTSLDQYQTDAGTSICRVSPDALLDGTNLLQVPTTCTGWEFSYGPNSFFTHIATAQREGLAVHTLGCPHAFDIDTPSDLTLAQETFPHEEIWNIL